MKNTVKKRFSAIALTLLLTVSMLSVFATGASAQGTVQANRWMSAVGDAASLTAINIPGTHASATQYVNGGIVLRTQSLSIPQQLNNGARYLEVGLFKSDTAINVVHGAVPCRVGSSVASEQMTTAHIVEYLKAFLTANPTETVLLRIKEDAGNAGTALYSEFYNAHIKSNPELWFTENRIPTLGEARGKIVLLRSVSVDTAVFDDTNSGINFTQYPYINSQEPIDFRRCNIDKLTGETYAAMYVQDSSRLATEQKWNAVKSFLDSSLSPNDFNICGTYSIGTNLPQLSAQEMNSLLMTYSFQKGKLYGIINMDYLNIDASERVFCSNEGVTAAPRPTTEPSTSRPFPTLPPVTGGGTLPGFSQDDDLVSFPTSPNTTTRPDSPSDESTTAGGFWGNIFDDDWWEGEEQPTESHTDAQGNPQYQNKSSGIGAFLLSILAGIAVFVGSGVVTYFLIKRQNKKEKEASESEDE